MVIKIRRAGALESDLLTGIAKAAGKSGCGTGQNGGGSKESFNISSEFIFWNDVFAAEIGGEVAGFYALSVEDNHFRLEYLSVKPKFSDLGVGQKLISHAIEHYKKSNARRLLIMVN